MGCQKAQGFLERVSDLKVGERVDARKMRLGRAEALRLARQARRIIAGRGQKLIELDLRKDRPDDDELAGLLLGPSGNLRAPTLRIGDTLLVGFNEAAYEQLFGRTRK
jgi:arsenate reductase-like glutaredoxin family protein